jgi:hypothetical protein
LLRDFEAATEQQRLDSTLLCSNMRQLRRGELFAEVLEKFLRSLSEVQRAGVEAGIVERYQRRGKGGCFSQVKPSQAKRKLEQMAQDLVWLVEHFAGEPAVAQGERYGQLCRLLKEQCEVVEGPKRVRVKAPKEVSADSLQNPSDPDASYDAHKGRGYQLQLMETYQAVPEGEEKDPTVPTLITYVALEPASASDMGAVEPALEETKRRGCAPQQLLADAGYGSDANVQGAKDEGVALIAPSNPGQGAPQAEERVGLDRFEFEADSPRVKACPAGHAPLETRQTPGGKYTAVFDPALCRACPLQARCRVRVKAQVAVVPYYTEKKQRLAVRRARERTEAFQEQYRWRAGIEGTFSRFKDQLGAGRLRVRGRPAMRYAAKLKALGMNILRCGKALAASAKAKAPRGPAGKASKALSGAFFQLFLHLRLQSVPQKLAA